MKIQLLSDLHLEFHADLGVSFIQSLDPINVDVLVLAGDILSLQFISTVTNTLLEFCKKYKEIIYLPGNHEYYNTTPQAAEQVLLESIRNITQKGYSNFNRLSHGDVKTVTGHRFLGDTLWFKDRIDNIGFKQYMTDFRVIKDLEPWVYQENSQTIDFLNKNLQEGDILVTHHLPLSESIHSKYRGSLLNRFFVCDLSDLIREKQPALALHGHTHESIDYQLGNTRVVCNPFGYVKDNTNPNFNENLIIEI